MANTFLISDTHFGHEKTWKVFKNKDGSPLRPFTSTEEMDETMVANWNRVVRPEDRVYHLGDVAIRRSALSILSRLNGRKVLIKGNHDLFKLKDYIPYFEDIRAYWVLEKALLSHVPIHPESFSRFRANIHGHTHGNLVSNGVDKRYISVCVEKISYTPVAWEDLRKVIKQLPEPEDFK